jgi:MSHA pilin protein MshC
VKKEPSGSFFHSGFSLIELVVIIIIIGIITVVASARISGSVAQTRGFYDELLSQVQFARKVAIAQRRPVFVRIEATESRLCYTAAGDCGPPTPSDAVASPTGDLPFRVAVPAGVAVSASTFQFDALGRPRDSASVLRTTPLVLTVTGDGNYQLTVEHETGYVRQ